MAEAVHFLRELRPAAWDGQRSGATECLVLAGGRHYRVYTLACKEYPDIRQALVFRSDAQGWPVDWGTFICLNGMDRAEALAELGRRVEAKRRQLQGVAA